MFGPPSSPPASYLSRQQESELKSSLLPAFGHEGMPRREFVRSKFTIYKDGDTIHHPANDEAAKLSFLPTPLPTSEANQASSPIPSSPQRSAQEYISPSQASSEQHTPLFGAPLQQLIVARIPFSGEVVTIGRSSKSSKVSLKPANRLASRVHAKVYYDDTENLIRIECLGWNGLVVSVPQDEFQHHSNRKTYPVARHQVLNIEKTEGITLDIHGDKVLIELVNDLNASDVTEDEFIPSSSAGYAGLGAPARKYRCISTRSEEENKENLCKINETRRSTHQQVSAVSPKESQIINENNTKEGNNNTDEGNAEDLNTTTETKSAMADAPRENIIDEECINDGHKLMEESETNTSGKPNLAVGHHEIQQQKTQEVKQSESHIAHQSLKFKEETLSESTAEADSRASSVEPAHTKNSSNKRKARKQHVELSTEVTNELKNVIANFVAFSRLSAVPFSSVHKSNTTLQSLPRFQVRELIGNVACVGVIPGIIEDTTGRKSEDTYYYMPELDTDEERRQIVQNTKRHRSLRNCRKTPKQYFYRPLNLD